MTKLTLAITAAAILMWMPPAHAFWGGGGDTGPGQMAEIDYSRAIDRHEKKHGLQTGNEQGRNNLHEAGKRNRHQWRRDDSGDRASNNWGGGDKYNADHREDF